MIFLQKWKRWGFKMKDEIKITLELLQDIACRDIIFNVLIKQAKRSEIECVTVIPSKNKGMQVE